MAAKKPVSEPVVELTIKEKTVRGLKREAVRGLILAAVLAYMYKTDADGFGVVTYMLAFLLVIALSSHYVRRLMFPYIDMGVIANKADETPQSSAMVFLGVSIIIASTIFAGAQFLK